MRRPKILFVLQRALGWNTYASRLERIVKKRDDITFDIMNLEGDRWSTFTEKRHNMSRLDKLFRHQDPVKRFQGSKGRQIRERVKEFQPDAIHFAGHLPAASIAFTEERPVFSAALDVTRAVIERDMTRNVWTKADMAQEHALFQQSALLFPMSTWAANSLEQDCGVPPDRIRVMPPSVSVADTPPNRAPPKEKLQIIFIGNDFRRKGGDRLRSWIAGPLSGLAELHVVSTDPDARGTHPGVTFHGRVPNDQLINELLPAMNVFCLPTRSDMSPQVLAEAAAAGLPSVTSDIAGVPDLVINGRTGITVSPEDDDAFIAALRKMATDRDYTQSLGNAAFQHAKSSLSSKANFNLMIDAILKMAETNSQNLARGEQNEYG